jgi:CheY-specific phosphatase CheX
VHRSGQSRRQHLRRSQHPLQRPDRQHHGRQDAWHAPEEVDNGSWDALGEIANMIAGNFKGKLDGVGNRCLLSAPTIIIGNDYETRSLAPRNTIELTFEFERKPLWVTLELHQ